MVQPLDPRWQRNAMLYKEEGVELLLNKKVMVVGIGGVGAMAAEALARSSVGTIILVDSDKIQISNLNRQIHATEDTIDQYKTEVMRQRILSIHPKCHVITHTIHFDESQSDILEDIDFVIDAIDTISCKLDLLQSCQQKDIPCISCLGMGNRMDPSMLEYSRLDKTSGDPLAKAMRTQARKRNMDLKKIMVVCSKEQPVTQNTVVDEQQQHRKDRIPPSSSAFVPNAAGLLCASYVVRNLLNR